VLHNFNDFDELNEESYQNLTIFIGTSNNYFLEFCKGQLKHCIKLEETPIEM